MMTSKADMIQTVQEMVNKIEEPRNMKRFQSFDRVMLMTYTDLSLDVTIIFRDGKATVTEGATATPDMTIVTDSTTILGILDGTKSAMRSFMSGKIKADGPARDLMKLQHLLKA